MYGSFSTEGDPNIGSPENVILIFGNLRLGITVCGQAAACGPAASTCGRPVLMEACQRSAPTPKEILGWTFRVEGLGFRVWDNKMGHYPPNDGESNRKWIRGL